MDHVNKYREFLRKTELKKELLVKWKAKRQEALMVSWGWGVLLYRTQAKIYLQIYDAPAPSNIRRT